MNSALDQKIRRSIDVLEGNSAQRPGISAKRNRDPLAEACNEVRRILADEEYWPKAYTNRALHGLFDVLDKDDANLRILADQCLNAILRKFLIKGHSSRTLAVLLNEIGRKASARGFVAALTMLEATLHYAKEARVSVYAMHLFNSMKETIKRPEQAIQSSIEQLFPQICSFFKLDLTDQHYRYVDALCLQCFENLQLPGVANRAAVALLAAFYENFPQIRTKIAHNLLDTLRIAEEVNDKNKIVGSFNFFKKAWNFVKDENVIHAVLYRCLCALKSSMSEIQVAVLELLDVVCSSDSLNLLEFKPSLFIDQSYQSSSDLESLNNVSITEKDFVLDGEESTNISRFNSVNSLEESLPPTARSEVSEDNDVFNKDSDDEDTASGRTSKSGNDQVESDPLFRPNSPSEYLLDNVEEQQESPTDSSYQLIDGPLCEKLPKVPDQQQASKQPFQQQHFVYYTCYTVLSKFLLSGKPGELKSDTDVRISIKVMVLKVMANIVGKYEGVLIKNDTESTWNITDVVLGGQSFMDIQSLIQSSDDTLAVRCFEVFANLEARLVRSGVKYKQTAMPSKFSIHLVQLLRQPNPMKLKELFQILTKTQIILQDQNTLKTVLNSAIDTFDCDYFLLKIARAEFLSKIRWDLVNPMIKEQYQKKCLLLLIKNLFDSDYRVSQAVAEVFSSAVKNAELSKLSNIFNVSCPEDITGFSLSQQPQIYALHPNYSFRGDCPDLLYEHNLTVAITMLYDEFCTSKNAAGFIIGLLSLTDAFSPNIYGNAWALELSCHNFQKSVIDVLVELADSTISQPSLMVSTLRLIGQISNGIAENLMTKQKCQIQQEKNCIEDVIVLHTRVVNMYFTVIRESSAKSTVNMSSPMFTKRNWVQGGGRDSASENRSYSISHLVGTGVHPTRPTSYTSSLSLRRIEPLIRGAFTNFQTSLKKNSEERCILLLNTALDGLSALLEVVPRDVLNLFLDEFFVYIKTIMHVSLASCTALISQLLKVIFDGNAYHIDINTLVSLRLKNSVVPNDQLDMYIGRSINAFSVYLAFLDRSEHFTTHQLRHFGWLNKNKSSVATTRSSSHALEIGTRLEQFERFVTFLMHAFMNNSQKEVRGNILTLLGVLVMNDVRYDKLDPQSRIWKSVLQIVRHPNLKYANEFESLFKFICLVTRVIDVSFDELIALLTKCIEHSNEENCHHLMDGLHIVVLEAVGYYAKVPESLISVLKAENSKLFALCPDKTIQLWTIILHWARTTQSDCFYHELSTGFVGEIEKFIDVQVERSNFDMKMVEKLGKSTEKQGKSTDFEDKTAFFGEKSTKFDQNLADSILIGLKTCHPSTFKPMKNVINLFVKSLSLGWLQTLPFMNFLLCRIDLDMVLVQVNDVVDNAVDKLSSQLTQLLLSAVEEIFTTTSAESEALEETLASFQVSLLHIFRAEPKFYSQFRIIIDKAIETQALLPKILKIAFLAPKVYGSFMTLLVQLGYFNENVGKWFYGPCTFHAKQLASLLLVQRLTDKRMEVTTDFEDFLKSLPEEMIVRMLKLMNEKQVQHVKQVLTAKTVNILVEKCCCYLKINPVVPLYYPLQVLASKEGLSLESTVKWINGLNVTKTDDNLDEKLSRDAKVYIELIKSINNGLKDINHDVQDDLDCLAQVLFNLNTDDRHTIIQITNVKYRKMLISRFFNYINDELCRIAVESYRIDRMRDCTKVVNIVTKLVKYMEKNRLNTKDIHAILCGISDIPAEFHEFERVRIGNFDKVLNDGFVTEMIESDLKNTNLDVNFYKAFTELIKRSDLSKYDQNDMYTIENLSPILSMLLDQIERLIPKSERLKIDKICWKVQVGNGEHEEVLETFILCQKAAKLVKIENSTNFEHFEEIKRAVLALLRLNIFAKMFIFPEKALKRGHNLQIEPQKDQVYVPLISIHLLSDYEILSDFVQRIFLLGWTKKSQFEEIWMSLFGVLCSTPIGNELGGEDVQQIMDQLSASTLAVEALTGMLTMSLLYPTPGDTVNSRFMVKTRQTRDSYLFLNSLNGRKASIARCQVETSPNPTQIFCHNLENLKLTTAKYCLGQTSVFYLWNMTGEVEQTNSRPGMSKSVSDYLIQASTDLDTVSSLKSLLENYFHWLENGYKTMPIQLLATTIKSIAIISDMFDDINIYIRVYTYFKEIYTSGHLQNHPNIGLLSYCLLKFVAIVDLERLDSDPQEARKLIDTVIQQGLEQENVFVFDCLLQGVLYLLQSVIVDEFTTPLKAVGDIILGSLERINWNYDLIHKDEFETTEHQKLLWTVVFCISEQLGKGESEFDQRFTKLTKTVFMDPRVPTWQKKLVASGIHGLICHSTSFINVYRECAVELFDTYQLRPNHLEMTLSVYFTCIYRSIQDQARYTQQQVDQFREEFQKILNLFSYYTLKTEIQRFLPPIAECFLVFFTKNELFDIILSLISQDDKTECIGDYDRCIYHLLHYTIQRSINEKTKETMDFVRFFLMDKINRMKSEKIKGHVKSLVMASVGNGDESSGIVPLLLRRSPYTNIDMDIIHERSKELFLKKAQSLNIKLTTTDLSLIDNNIPNDNNIS